MKDKDLFNSLPCNHIEAFWPATLLKREFKMFDFL